MHQLEQMFPSLTLFSDLDWALVTQEYETDYIDHSFPEYLQKKALDGDCPVYLFELAYFEQAQFEIKASLVPFPHLPGIYLNPTALFLSLEFDIETMIRNSKSGKIEVIEYPHVKSLFKNHAGEVRSIEVTTNELEVLESLEDGPLATFNPKNEALIKLIDSGLVLNLLK